jgi:hypothetical protein
MLFVVNALLFTSTAYYYADRVLSLGSLYKVDYTVPTLTGLTELIQNKTVEENNFLN